MEYYLVTKNKRLPFVTVGINLEDMMSVDINHSQRYTQTPFLEPVLFTAFLPLQIMCLLKTTQRPLSCSK